MNTPNNDNIADSLSPIVEKMGLKVKYSLLFIVGIILD